MRFIDRWGPLIVCIREGRSDIDEVAQLSSGFEPHFERGQPYAVLSVSHQRAAPPSAQERRRLAEWANHERVRRASRELCVGAATVMARDWERHAFVALSWLWKPVAPHQAVSRVSEGVNFCLSSLIARRVRLPVARDTLAAEVQRVLAAEDVAGVEASRGAPSPAGVPASTRGGIETLSNGLGSIQVGWVGSDVLWARFEQRLSLQLATTYVARLGDLLGARTGVQFFVDAAALDSYELSARDATTRALMGHRQCFSRLVLLNWSGGMSSAAQAGTERFGATIEVVGGREEFEEKLRLAAPLARERIASSLGSAQSRPRS